jgi:ubiquinone/menaquinone biosynthesis C-methylase UbiE
MVPVTNAISRFFTRHDPHDTHIVYRLPDTWWSRPYEYAWAATFARPADTVLDAACGVGHPFKFLLAERAATVYACDADPRLASRDAVLDDIRDSAGAEVADGFDPGRFDQVRMDVCDLAAMPYPDRLFDRVFCISVFEHLDEAAQVAALAEFARVLDDDGLLVLTVDHPTVDLARLAAQMPSAGLGFAGATDFTIPADAISSSLWGPELRCVRLVIGKR